MDNVPTLPEWVSCVNGSDDQCLPCGAAGGAVLRTGPGTQEVPSAHWLFLFILHTALGLSPRMPVAGLLPSHMPVTDPRPAAFQRPQALLLSQLRPLVPVTAAFPRLKDAAVTQAVPIGTPRTLRRVHTAPQGQREGCQDTPAAWHPASGHLSWASEPKGSLAT